MTEHVGYDMHAVEGRNGAHSRNGTRTETVLTDNIGEVQIEVPRDGDGSFSPAHRTAAVRGRPPTVSGTTNRRWLWAAATSPS